MKDGFRRNNMVEFLDTIFVVNGEMIKNNGEDSFAFCVKDNYAMIGIFDGCGGIGSRKYDVYNDKTGAYVSSHVVSETFYNWFDEFCKRNIDISENFVDEICVEIRNTINENLKNIEKKTTSNLIKGSLTKSFPTTASIALMKCENNELKVSFIWAGDSRGFVLTTEGLTQITKDDVEGEEDALSNLSNDGRLSNVISADGNYLLNNIVITPPESGIIISATDGCFGYYMTPMEFEYMLVDTLCASSSINDWKNKIDQKIRKITGDDYTIGIAVYGYDNFKILKKEFAGRRKVLQKSFISKLEDISEIEKKYLWNKYKKIYYRSFK